MSTKERWYIIFTLLLISLMTCIDIVSDFSEGASKWHLIVESTIALIALYGVYILLKGHFDLKKRLENAYELSQSLQLESKKWKEYSKKYIQGLSQSIDEQLTKWQLSRSEKEVAFLLIKGFSFKEISQFRNTTEKTARTQSASIYAKANLANRSQLSAFFLEDLLAPNKD
jgi:DNA-binding NarL/FixJ family response regulator